jgi:hypothetical protein
MSFLMSSTSIRRYDFNSEPCISGVLGYPGLAEVGVLGSDDVESSCFLLVSFLRLPFAIWYSLELVVIVVSVWSLFLL